jgi:putative hydrolase of the HAD superfamily
MPAAAHGRGGSRWPVVPQASDISRGRRAAFRRRTSRVPRIVIVVNGTEIRGVITDWGGVLTTPILAMVQAWIQADGIDWDSYVAVMRAWIAEAYDHGNGQNPIHLLERGECSSAEFERVLAARLLSVDGGVVRAEGLLRRMFAASVPVPAMYETIRVLRGAGYRTALLSNSWGCHEYPRADFPGLFDVVVISGEVGMRKPEEAIFRHAARALGLEPRECVFIDDVEANVAAAAACGMTGLLHTEAAATAAALQDLLGVPLSRSTVLRGVPRHGAPEPVSLWWWRNTRIRPARAVRPT